MKILYKLSQILFAIVLCIACSNEDDLFSSRIILEKGITATMPNFQFEDGTRVSISDDFQSVTWSDNDELGIYYSDEETNAHASYTIKQGGSNTGLFSNNVFYLNKSKSYYAFYPYKSSHTTTVAEVDYTGQLQDGNGSVAHLSNCNYMYGKVDIANDGSASVNFKNLGAVMVIKLQVPETELYSSLTIKSSGSPFIIKGKANMVDGTIEPYETSTEITLPFSNMHLDRNNVLVASLLIAPVNLEGNTLTITLTDRSNFTYWNVEGKNMQAGKAYTYEGKLTDAIKYITFTAEAEQTLQMSQEVPSLEYSVNGGTWMVLGTNEVTFGDTNGNLRLRGKSSVGTNGAKITFGNPIPVDCCGDIRTLVDYENYDTADNSKAVFSELFMECSQLTSSPVLPCMQLAPHCYEAMFYGCSSLTQAPELPATTLADYCYKEMFHGCTSLTTAPELPATKLADSCYMWMFSGCTSLTVAPELPATTLANSCYERMFSGTNVLPDCTNIDFTSETVVASGGLRGLFSGTKVTYSDLTRILPKGTNNKPCLPVTTLAEYCYRSMFQSCAYLTQAPELPATTLANNCYEGMFYWCTSLTSAPELPAMTLASECYAFMFYGCTSLTKAPELPATTLADSCYRSMFCECRSLSLVPNLPATSLTYGCYQFMFVNCTSLTQAPELPAITLVRECYYEMFNGCSSLNYIKMMATDISEFLCLSNWVLGVASEGTFIKNSVATWNIKGESGIPEGWTVKTADN